MNSKKVNPSANIKWLNEYYTEYAGQWVAIRNGEFIASAPTCAGVIEKVGPTKGSGILVTPIYSSRSEFKERIIMITESEFGDDKATLPCHKMADILASAVYLVVSFSDGKPDFAMTMLGSQIPDQYVDDERNKFYLLYRQTRRS
jgi:hypothetical protein